MRSAIAATALAIVGLEKKAREFERLPGKHLTSHDDELFPPREGVLMYTHVFEDGSTIT